MMRALVRGFQMIQLSSDEFLNLTKSKYMVVLFSSKTCEFCEAVKSQVEENVEKFILNPNVNFFMVETNEQISKKYGVTIIPALGVFKNNIEYFSKVGLFENEDEYTLFKNSIDSYLGG
jgi:thiol-disulfide isomerase/thioredoxin